MRRMFSENQLENKIESVIESGEVENAKPIYCHLITLYSDVENWKIIASLLVFDNSATEYTKESLVSFLKTSLGRFLISGSYFIKSGDHNVICSYVRSNVDGSKLYLMGIDETGKLYNDVSNQIDFELIVNNVNYFTDSINKIN